VDAEFSSRQVLAVGIYMLLPMADGSTLGQAEISARLGQFLNDKNSNAESYA
jgi:hypothetical protein